MSDTKFGEVITSINFSLHEKSRIVNALKDETSPIYKIFCQSFKSPAITDNKFCAWLANKKLNVLGDRDGGEAQRTKIVNKCIAFAKGTPSMESSIFWMIYRNTAINYVKAKLPSLQQLLLDNKYEGTLRDSLTIFRRLFELRSNFDVEIDDIKSLYMIWGFERDQHVENLFITTSVGVDSKEVEKISDQVDDLKLGVANDLHQAKLSLKSAVNDLQDQITAVEDNATEIKNEISKISKDVDNKHANFNKSLDNIRQDVRILPDQRVIRGLRAEIENISDSLSQALIKITKLNENQNLQSKELSRINEKIGRKFLENKGSNSNQVRKVDAGKNKISEIEFIVYWKSKLVSGPFASLNSDELLACHIFFKTFKAIIIQDSMLYDNWLEALGWKSHLIVCVAEPVWLKSSDCVALGNFVNANDTPSILRINNFNSAIVDGYLLPNIIPWLIKEEYIDRKLVLIPTEGEQESLREVVAEVPMLMSSFGKLDPAPVMSRTVQPGSFNEAIFVSTLAVWESIQSIDPEDNRGLLTIFESHDLEIPPTVINNYNILRCSFSEYYDANSSILAAYQMVILPWIKYCKNEVYAEKVTQSLKEIYE